ncbi:uncharacterized protein LACBIDRAFT_326749 [Laccaria bicolor S238N-H82]|uniref:Predicted protein n=1 Tax=Laccaria bicolor (strain S238N-H82 / ATCC MYA-4686) TaxID=486041 RepID=B0D9J9_LACBS|nr:uncharacterized protein LACBIDRAFT_326749 [Laccaria bicolor S238N-H82]EDR08366.1 predicted protein [Laccaria bicolor S238N-H82]|eukprot:XP_001880591.1 predicted protein [Laccaria bicolor S238N-H82]
MFLAFKTVKVAHSPPMHSSSKDMRSQILADSFWERSPQKLMPFLVHKNLQKWASNPLCLGPQIRNFEQGYVRVQHQTNFPLSPTSPNWAQKLCESKPGDGSVFVCKTRVSIIRGWARLCGRRKVQELRNIGLRDPISGAKDLSWLDFRNSRTLHFLNIDPLTAVSHASLSSNTQYATCGVKNWDQLLDFKTGAELQLCKQDPRVNFISTEVRRLFPDSYTTTKCGVQLTRWS